MLNRNPTVGFQNYCATGSHVGRKRTKIYPIAVGQAVAG
jgi:hypothetical protein